MLLTPGPTPVPEFVRVAMSTPTIHHRTKEFEEIFAKTRDLLKQLLNMPESIVLASSGTGAMEASIINFAKRPVVINSGKFGERFGKICDSFNIDKKELKYPWDTPANVDDVVNAVKEFKADSICIQVCESAGGLRHPVEEIAKEVKAIDENIIIIADGITAVGVEPIDTTNIDILITGSQKALMLPPGLAILGLSQRAVDSLSKNNSGYYFNLYSELKKQQNNTTAYTAATTLIIGLKEILSYLNKKGLDNLYKNTAKLSLATKRALESIDLKIYPKNPANAMSAVYFEEANELRKILKEKFDVNIAGGQDHLKGKLFRINHMGLVNPYEMSWCLNSIEKTLEILGIREFDSTANKVFMNEFF